MERRRCEFLPAFVIATVILLTSPSLYGWAYISLSDKIMSVDGRFAIRAYRSKPLAVLFRPAAAIEGLVEGCSVSTQAVQ
jgi:hypothetical protein